MTAPLHVAEPQRVPPSQRAVLLFDERCSVCRRFVSFVTGRDRGGALWIAPLHSRFGDLVRREHTQFSQRDSALFVRPDGTILAYSDAILATLEQVGGFWRHVAHMLWRVPRRLRDRAYTAFAKHRGAFAAFGLATLDETSSSRMLTDRELEGHAT